MGISVEEFGCVAACYYVSRFILFLEWEKVRGGRRRVDEGGRGRGMRSGLGGWCLKWVLRKERWYGVSFGGKGGGEVVPSFFLLWFHCYLDVQGRREGARPNTLSTKRSSSFVTHFLKCWEK